MAVSNGPVERPGWAGMEWSQILRSRTGRPLEIDGNGIAWNAEFSGSAGQADELKTREQAAAPFLGSSEQALREAVRHHSRGVMRRRARQILEDLAESTQGAEAVMVDLGSGFGWHWVGLAKEFASVKFVLVDFAATNLRICRTLMPFHEYPNVLCLHSDVTAVPLEDHVVDCCWSVQVLQHLPPEKRRIGFQEINRLLNQQGRFYFAWLRSVPLARFAYALFGKPYHQRGFLDERTYLQRFDNEIHKELIAEFGPSRLTYSETLFHPDLRWAPSSRLIGALDLWLGKTRLARLLARQVEFQSGPHSLRGQVEPARCRS